MSGDVLSSVPGGSASENPGAAAALVPLTAEEQASLLLSPNSPPASEESVQRVFEYAWHRFNAFDARSGALKKRYRRVREAIIMITWLTTLLAVLAALSQFERVFDLLLFGLPVILLGYVLLTAPYHEIRNMGPLAVVRLIGSSAWEKRMTLLVFAIVIGISMVLTLVLDAIADQLRRDIFKLMLVIFPLLSTGLLTFASRFEAGIAWVGFRLVAESVRRKIYELRVLMNLRPLTKADLEELRTHVLEQRNRLDEMGIITPLWGSRYEPSSELVRPNWTDHPEDEGYGPMTVDNYVNWRLTPQANWYRGRIQDDYHKTRVYRAWILFIGALGAFLAAVDYGEFVAVTVAGITGLQAWLSLREHEQSYNIHVRTLLQLEDRIASYFINLKRVDYKDEKTPLDALAITSYVQSVEDILEEERNMWQASVLQGQEATEGALAQLVSAGQEDWEGPADEEEEERKRDKDKEESEEDEAQEQAESQRRSALDEPDHTVIYDALEAERVQEEAAPAAGMVAESPPMDAAPVDAAPMDAAPVDAAPVDAAPMDAAPVDTAPVDAAPVDAAPVDAAPMDAAPVDTAPMDAAPMDAAPMDAAFGEVSEVQFVVADEAPLAADSLTADMMDDYDSSIEEMQPERLSEEESSEVEGEIAEAQGFADDPDFDPPVRTSADVLDDPSKWQDGAG